MTVYLFCTLLFIPLSHTTAYAQTGFTAFGTNTDKEINPNPLEITEVLIAPQSLNAGESAEITLKFKLAPGYHAYLDQYKLELLEPKDAYLSEFQVRPTVKFVDPITKKTKVGTADFAEMVALFEVPKNINGGAHNIKLKLTYQACGEDFCLFPKSIETKTSFDVPMRGEDALSRALSQGIISALLLVFIAGFLTSLTPCIFPMIPITLAVIGTKGVSGSRWRGLTISLTYVLGIALTYAVLGVVAARTGALFGALLGHPVVVGIIAILFVAMGLSMYGLYEIQMPKFITQKLGGTRTQKGYIGAFGSGLIAGVVASPCVGPVLVSILAYVARTQDSVLGFVLLFVFALGLGQLFILMGTFQSLLHKLPKSGAWMENVKFIFGTIMIGMALYFIHPITDSALFSGLIATVLIALSFFFGAFSKNQSKWQKAIARVAFVAGLLFAIRGFIPEHMLDRVFPFSAGQSTSLNYAKPDWANYSEALLMAAQLDGRPVILDFQAEWCLACKELEIYTFSDPRVLELGKQFLWLKFDATKSSPELDVLQEKYGISGLPFIAFFDKKGNWRSDITLLGFEKAEPFLKRMEEVLK